MTETEDRRAPGVNRVTVARVVDICGRDQTVPAFEAESVELSGRGMHVRTPFLPPLGAPLVCRLEDGGREIVVEGVVAWQKDVEGGGEFGVKFTALDSGSVEALKDLCGLREAMPEAPTHRSDTSGGEPAAPGTPVKLHIEGLGAPMKARVKDGGSRRLQVGSNLEFLKVGRGLEVEDVEQGDRRGARIDAVSIAIDPKTQVPQLVVVLRYDGQDATPEPSVVGDEESAPLPDEDEPMFMTGRASPDGTVESVDTEDEAAAAAMRGRMDHMAVSVGKTMQRAGKGLALAGGGVAAGVLQWAKGQRARAGEIAARHAATAARRTTAPAPQSAKSGAQRRLRPQNGSEPAEASPTAKRRKLLIGVGAGTVVCTVTLALALSGRSDKEGPKAESPVAASTVAAAPVPAMPVTAGFPVAAAVPPMSGAAPQATAAPAGPGQSPGVIANVPLFGPTPMATLEPAPLGPSPEELARAPKAASAVEERMGDEGAASKEAARDETFDDRASEKKGSEVKPEDVKPVASGKLYFPVIHRIKLDKAGAALKGTKEENGFSVVIPGRKTVEGGGAITKRDDRIANVKTNNGPAGAKITFAFRSKVPSYKVRLKRDYVEFFISSPGTAGTAK